MGKHSAESQSYAMLGASSAKAGILAAAGEATESRYFATPIDDPFGDQESAFFLHADGAGTKSIVAYLMFRESGDVSWFKSLAVDSLVMNLDDVACSGGLSGLAISNTIARNRGLIPDEAIASIISGYRECAATLAAEGVSIILSGGETADMGDLVRTLVVDSTLCARIKREELVDAFRVVPGDAIVAFSSTGKCRYEKTPNSGIGSNGLTLARNVLLSRSHAEKYPEVRDPAIPASVGYRGPFQVTDPLPTTSMTVGEALLSPTRSYAPLISKLLLLFRGHVHSLVHCTGGGQTKIKRFGRGVRFVKNNLFPCPPLFEQIQRCGHIPWSEMFAVFNMGHRLEACVPAAATSEIIAVAGDFGIDARVVGQVTCSSGANEVVLESPYGTFVY